MDLTCPKCHASMRAYERSGVTLEQCTECRGIFLDRGEFERLAEAEFAYHQRGGGAPPAGSPAWGDPERASGGGREHRGEYRDRGEESHRDRYRDHEDDDRHRYGGGDDRHDPRYRKRRRRGFLDDLLDFD
jgi:hypothetical protein